MEHIEQATAAPGEKRNVPLPDNLKLCIEVSCSQCGWSTLSDSSDMALMAYWDHACG